MGIETPGMEKIESIEGQGVGENLAQTLKNRVRGIIDKVEVLGMHHPSARQLAMVGALMAARIMIVNTPDFDLGGMGMGLGDMEFDKIVESFSEVVASQEVVSPQPPTNPDGGLYAERWDNPGPHPDVWNQDGSRGDVQPSTNLRETVVETKPESEKSAIEWLGKGKSDFMERSDHDVDFKFPENQYPANDDRKTSFDEIKKGIEVGGRVPTSFIAGEKPTSSFEVFDKITNKGVEVGDPGPSSFKAGGQVPSGGQVGGGAEVDGGNSGKDPIPLGKVVQGEGPEGVQIGEVVKGNLPEGVELGNRETPKTAELGGNNNAGEPGSHKKIARLGKLWDKLHRS